MVRRVPAALGLVPLEHGEVSDPQQLEVAVLESAVALGILLSERKTKLSGGRVNAVRLLACLDSAGSFCSFGASDHNHQVFRMRLRKTADFRAGLGERFLQPLDVLEDLGLFAIAEQRLDFVAFLAREFADLGNANR